MPCRCAIYRLKCGVQNAVKRERRETSIAAARIPALFRIMTPSVQSLRDGVVAPAR
jgi:hypothetical protein